MNQAATVRELCRGNERIVLLKEYALLIAFELESLAADRGRLRKALERVWDIEEMGYTPDDPESESGTCTCNKCEAVMPHGQHSENCPQPIIEAALKGETHEQG